MTRRIVITGGPGTGKTVLVHELERLGYLCFHEIIRDMTQKAKTEEAAEPITNPLAFVADPLAFNKQILQGRIDQFHGAEALQDPFVFYDRGIPDVIAYMDYFGQSYDGTFIQPCQDLRYDMAIVLPPWKEIYRQDEERLESFREAQEIHECLLASYRLCGYQMRELMVGPLEARVQQLLELIRSTHG